MSNLEFLEVEARDSVRIVSINRPQVLNALNTGVITELSHVLSDLGHDPAVRGIVLRGAGEKAFVAGADIAEMQDMTEAQALDFAETGHAVGEMIAHLPVPVVAAVQGFALGGGCELALACDWIVASPRAKFGQPEVKLGVIPGFGGTQRLLRRIGVARALELCLTGEMIDAQEALRIGLVNRIVESDQLVEQVVASLQTIAQWGPLAIEMAKRVIHEGAQLPLSAANQLEVEGFAKLFSTQDQKEGMSAFVGKRAPKFTGQ